MLTKIFFTIVVIAAVLIFFSLKRGGAGQASYQTAASGGSSSSRPMVKWLAMIVIAIMLIGSVLFFYWEWRMDHEVMVVKVIDVRSGGANSYRAYKGDVGERSFKTLDGRRVSLAETERLETQPATRE